MLNLRKQEQKQGNTVNCDCEHMSSANINVEI